MGGSDPKFHRSTLLECVPQTICVIWVNLWTRFSIEIDHLLLQYCIHVPPHSVNHAIQKCTVVNYVE